MMVTDKTLCDVSPWWSIAGKSADAQCIAKFASFQERNGFVLEQVYHLVCIHKPNEHLWSSGIEKHLTFNTRSNSSYYLYRNRPQ